MDIKKIIQERRSVRSYDPEKEISDAQLRELFDLVKMSPSGYNLQPWEFVVVRSEAGKKKLNGCTNGQQHIEDASANKKMLGGSSCHTQYT